MGLEAGFPFSPTHCPGSKKDLYSIASVQTLSEAGGHEGEERVKSAEKGMAFPVRVVSEWNSLT